MKTETGAYIFPLKKHKDDRGWLMELVRNDSVPHPIEMAYLSETKPLVVRGPHEHTEQTDHFAFIGPGDFHLHLWHEDTYEIWDVGENNPCLVIVPPGVVHAYKNILNRPGWVFNAPDSLYGGPGKLYEVDEIRHENDEDSKYLLYCCEGWKTGGNLGDEPLDDFLKR